LPVMFAEKDYKTAIQLLQKPSNLELFCFVMFITHHNESFFGIDVRNLMNMLNNYKINFETYFLLFPIICD